MLAGEAPVHRPLGDISVWTLFDRGSPDRNTYVVGSITADRYLTVPGTKLRAIRAFIDCLDGQRTVGDIEQALVREHGLRVDAAALYGRFRAAGLLADGAGPPPGDIERMSKTVLRLPIGRLLRGISSGAALAVPLACLALAIIATAVVMYVMNPGSCDLMAAFDRQDSLMPFTGLAVLIAPLSVALHEFGHCFAAAVFGVTRGTFRVHLYLGIFPIAALKFAGLYTLPSRARLVIWSAGIFVNLSIAAACLIARNTFAPHSAVLEMAVASNWLLAIMNLVPFLPTDGYFLLTTLTKNPNVRVQAWRLLGNPFRIRRGDGSWLVFAYFTATVCFLAAVFWHYAVRLVNRGGQYATWQSCLALVLLGLLFVTLFRNLKRKGEYD